MKLSKQKYKEYVDSISPKSPMAKNLVCAFLIGGTICTIGQLILDGFSYLGLDEKDAGTATSIVLVFCGALLTGFSVYDNLAKHAGAGTLVPITGFANSVVSPAMEFKSEGLITGMAAKMFIIAGPVIVYGVSASVVYGIIYWIIKLVNGG